MKQRIRILHVMQPVGGGVARYVQMLLKYLDQEQFENVLLISKESNIDEYSAFCESIEQIDMRREIGLHDVHSVKAVREAIRKTRPDIIYAHSSKAGALVRIANLGIGKPCVYNPHGWAFNIQGSAKKQLLYTAVERMLAPFCTKIVCISETEKKSALDRKICREEKLQVIQNGIDISAYGAILNRKPDRKGLGIPVEAYVVGMVGRVSPQKAPDVFIRAAERIKQRIPEAFFVIVGNGELEVEIRQFAAEHGLSDALLITGWVSNPMAYIQCFDTAMLLSRWEGFGLVLAEYMLAQKPIVATEVDAIPELIQHGRNGLLVAADDCAAAAEAVCRLYKDSKLRKTLSQNALSQVKTHYDIRRVAQEHCHMFQNIIGNAGQAETDRLQEVIE